MTIPKRRLGVNHIPKTGDGRWRRNRFFLVGRKIHLFANYRMNPLHVKSYFHNFNVVVKARPMNNRILLLVQSPAHAAALMSCVPHLIAHYQWVWAVYSPAVLVDEKTAAADFDKDIAELEAAMDGAYRRRDGAGGDQLKLQYDAKILSKTTHVKEAWKSMPEEQKIAAFSKIFRPFYEALKASPGMSVSINEAGDHFETAAHVEFQNSLKAGMKTGFVPGEYVVGWPTSLPKGSGGTDWKKLSEKVTELATPAKAVAGVSAQPPATPAKIDKRKGPRKIAPRLRELMQMDLDALGPIAFELGVKHNDPLMGKRMALVHEVHRREVARTADVDAY